MNSMILSMSSVPHKYAGLFVMQILYQILHKYWQGKKVDEVGSSEKEESHMEEVHRKCTLLNLKIFCFNCVLDLLENLENLLKGKTFD